MESTTGSMYPRQTHTRWCPVCRTHQHTPIGETPGPCRAEITVVGLEVHQGSEVLAICDTVQTRDAVAAFLRERV